LLSNLVLDELDRELERRGHRFVRYADDCNVYVRSEKCSATIWVEVVLPHPRMLPRSRPIASPRRSRCITCVSFGGGRT